MADRIFRGDAVALAQVWTATPANVEVGDVFKLTINGKLGVEYTAEAATVADVTAGITAAWNDSAIAEFTEITAADDGTHVTLTADTDGTPFWISASTVNSSSGNVTVEETTPGESEVNEVQKIELVGTYTAGTFTLTIDLGSGDETTGNIDYDATASAVQTAIEGLASVSAGDVVVTGGPGPDTAWFVTWTGNYAASEVNEFVVDGANLTGDGEVTVDTVTEGGSKSDEIKTLTLRSSTTGVAPSGTYTLSLGGEETADIAFNATAATLQAALEAIPTIGSGNVSVLGGVSANAMNQFYSIRFIGDLAGVNVGFLSADPSNLADGTVNIDQSVVDGGSSTVNEFQYVDLGQADGGTFTLSLDGQTTAAINHDDAAADIETALEALSTIADVRIHRPVASNNGSEVSRGFLVEFTGSDGNTNQSTLTGAFANLDNKDGGEGVTTVKDGGGEVDEVQSVKIIATGGTFTLTFDGQTTGNIAFGASAATVKSDLESLSNITTVSVTGTGTPADPYLVTFEDPGAQDVAEMTGDASSLTGGGGEVTEVTAHDAGTDEVQTITIGAGVTGGTWTASFRGVTSGNIAYDASAATVETALEALSTIDGVSVSGSAGGPWTVTFDVAPLDKTDVELLEADGSNLEGGSGDESLTLAETTRSEGPNHFDSARNWTGNRVPDSGDTIYLEEGSVDILYGLRQRTTFTADAGTDEITFAGDDVGFVDDQILRVKSSDTLPAGLSADTDYYVINLDRIAGTCQLSTSSGGSAVDITDTGTGTHTIALEVEGVKQIMRNSGDVGLPKRNDGDYYEYRPDYLEIGVRPGGDKQILLGVGDGGGSQLFKIDTSDYDTALEVHESGGSRQPGLPAILFKNDAGSGTTIDLLGGELGVGLHAGETTDVGAITQRGGLLSGGNETGSFSFTTLTKTGGSIQLRNVTGSGNISA